MKEEKKPITEVIEEACEKICNEYCKYYAEPDKYLDDPEDMYEAVCEKCPLNMLY